VKNSLTISNESLIDSVEITSILGQKMLSQKVNSLQTDVDLSALSEGIYFVKVTSEGQEKTLKIVKE
jgi:Secretion system C-terminal sorting domain